MQREQRRQIDARRQRVDRGVALVAPASCTRQSFG